MGEGNLKIGVVGAGVMGSGHLEYLSREVPGVTVAALAEPDESLRKTVLDRFNLTCPGFNTLEDMLDGVDLDGVVVASPDRFHAESIRLCLSRQMPTLCEKPLAQSLEDAEELSGLAQQSLKDVGHPLIHLGFMRRFDPPFVEVKKLIESGELGAVLYVNASTRNVSSGNIKSEELLTNIAIHEVDTIRWLLSDEWSDLKVLKGRSTSAAPEGTQDPIVLTGSTSNGVVIVADIFANNTYGYDVRCELTFEKGVVRVGIWGDVSVVKNHEHPAHPSFALGENWIARFRQAYVNELLEWTGTLRGKKSSNLATVDDGLRALQVLNWVV
jgi:myo-inositol 2-dehydrogenase/D-chiro-inositol 1-dehydrogenase|tara:strand:- start:4520 stop:5500 length:981 start_codon:yes stop_codon:yes gene_type:complete